MLPSHVLWFVTLILSVLNVSESQKCEDRTVNYKLLKSDNYESRSTNFCSNITLNHDVNYVYFNRYLSYVSALIITNSSLPILSASDIDFNRFEQVSLLNNSINKIKPSFFERFQNVYDLDLSKNNISNIGGIFFKLDNLKKINLSENSIAILPEHSFVGPKNLKVVDVSKNKISYVPTGVFQDHLSLKEIYLNNNLLTTITTSVFENLRLSLVDLSSNVLNEIIHNTPERINISSLYISNTSLNNEKLSKIPEQFNPVELTVLDLSHNKISVLSHDTFKDMINLRELYLDDNLLDTVGYESRNNWINVFSMKKLTNVSLDNNFWNCADLKDVIQTATSQNASVTPGYRFNGTNLLGIPCKIETSIQDGQSSFRDIEDFLKSINYLKQQQDNINIQFKNIAQRFDDMDLENKIKNILKKYLENSHITNNNTPEKISNTDQLQVKKYEQTRENSIENQKQTASPVDSIENMLSQMSIYMKNLTELTFLKMNTSSKELYDPAERLTQQKPEIGESSSGVIFSNILQLSKIPDQFNPVELTVLDLSHNQISVLSHDTFKDMINLRELYLDDNLLDTVEYESRNNWINVFSMKKLTNVSLDNNFWNCADLKDVIQTATSQNASVTPGYRFNGTNLLGIPCKIETSIQDELTFLKMNTSSKELYDPAERLTQQKPEIGESSSGVIFSNILQLSKIPDQFNPVELTVLDLSHNQISVLSHDTFKDMINLRELYLDDNLLDTVEYESRNNWINVFSMKKLTNVSLDNNFWNCADLKDVIQTATSQNASVTPGYRFNGTNLLGIPCKIERSIQDGQSSFRDIEDFLKSSNYLKQQQDDINIQFKNIAQRFDNMNLENKIT
ncbi:toll-like receptor Tollo [Sitophilus oryzae]|uniref:Toll-like receptor Tollo n=1 Tax=Sitophilus oryzae TaxID=7048 RepID=A0A6J2Y7S8_SITOR|nr:toll-like receptor Tollo [Sitophilus oryzae]